MNIQLIDCPACGSKVSSQAAACPHCGQPIRLIPHPVSHPVEKLPSTEPNVSNARVLSILGIIFTIGVFFGGWGLMFVIAGIIFGHIAVKKGDNLGKVTCVLGYIALSVLIVCLFAVFREFIKEIPAGIIVTFVAVLFFIIRAITNK